jgi:hypothetical protein
MHQSNIEFARAFPAAVHDDALTALAALPETPWPARTFTVTVASEGVSLRIYHNPALIKMTELTSLQQEIISCLLTRHHDGIIREEHLKRIIRSNHVWIPPFVIQLIGEYVVEILDVIHQNLTSLDTSTYGHFLRGNPRFFSQTKQRVASYWDCYYRNHKRSEYVGFKLVDFFEHLTRTH